MEFKEFDNPEQADYDIKVGAKAPAFTPPTTPNTDDLLNTDEGIDLNALGDEEFSLPVDNRKNPQYAINEFGEIIRDFKMPPTEDGFIEATGELVDDESKGMSR